MQQPFREVSDPAVDGQGDFAVGALGEMRAAKTAGGGGEPQPRLLLGVAFGAKGEVGLKTERFQEPQLEPQHQQVEVLRLGEPVQGVGPGGEEVARFRGGYRGAGNQVGEISGGGNRPPIVAQHCSGNRTTQGMLT